MNSAEALEFEIDFIACSYMFMGMSYEDARIQALEELKEIKQERAPQHQEGK